METAIIVMLCVIFLVTLVTLIYMTYDPDGDDEYEAMMDKYREDIKQYHMEQYRKE